MKEILQNSIFTAIVSGKTVTARRKGEDCNEKISLQELNSILATAVLSNRLIITATLVS